ncbi:MAG: spore germination protein [Clostridium sp.]|uniref:spore germination protein n=1 Tax=Clostridium sp. TaxID=1506 RepID=UPI003F3BB340
MNKYLKSVKEQFEGSFDVKYREVNCSLGKATLVFVDNICSGDFINEYIVLPLKRNEYECKNVEDLLENVLDLANYVKDKNDLDDIFLHIVSGDVVIFIENYEEVLFCEAKGMVRRGIGIPVTENVLKGPREGFNELFVDNISLLRRKMKNSNLKFEPTYVGKKSQTVVCLAYIKGVAPEGLIEYAREKIKSLNMEFLLDTNYVEDKLKNKNSIFDTVGYTEKPDEIAAKIMEGRVAILVDGTPFVITIPYFFLENFQMPDDYYINRTFANFTRVLRWMAFFLATFLPGAYVAIITYHFSVIPSLFLFRLAVSRAGIPIPTVLEVIIMMISFQIIKEAGLRLPQPIGSAMSIVSALILGEAAVGAGIASRITIIVIAISMLSYFLIPKMYSALSVWALVFVLAGGTFGLPGIFSLTVVFIAKIAELETGNYPYLFPLGSFEKFNFKDVLFRGKLGRISKEVVSEDEKDEKS